MSKEKKNVNKKRRRWIRFVKFEIVMLVLLSAGIAFFYFGGYAAKISKLRKEADHFVANCNEDTFKASQTSIAYDVNGNTLSVLKGEKDSYYVESDDIPSYVKQAIISIEDKKFYDHHGVDYQAIVRAAISYVKNRRITQGASTITQQLVKNVFLSSEQSWQRKLEEIFIATGLEKKFSKSQILEFYLNNIYFGNGYYGIQAASRGYFNKEVGDLSLSQAAFLCAIPNRPTYYDPVVNYGNTMKRRNQILDNMYDDGVISESTYHTAMNETITLERPPDEEHNNYLETFTFYCATRALMEEDGFQFKYVFSSESAREDYEEEYNAKYEEWNAKLYTGGYRIYTSLNTDTQAQLQAELDETLSPNEETGEDGIYTLQSAAVCIDNTTGMVRAIVGGRSQENISGYTLNRGFQSYRQPGSTIKPLIVYTPALERGYTAASVINDHPIEDGPKNATGRYYGDVSIRHAVEQSLNTPAWQLFEEMTPEVGLSYIQNMEFSNITEDDMYPAASLGGLTYGVSPLEMAKAYATLQNDGVYRDPSCILKITNALNEVIYKPGQSEAVIYEEQAAREMTDILEGVLVKGTAAGYALDDMACAGKTGTTNDNKDGWFCGYTPYYTMAVWVGYDQPQTLEGTVGNKYPVTIWHDFFTELHAELEPKEFVRPNNYNQIHREPVDYSEEEEVPEEEQTEEGEGVPPEEALPEEGEKPVEEQPTEIHDVIEPETDTPEEVPAEPQEETPTEEVPVEEPVQENTEVQPQEEVVE